LSCSIWWAIFSRMAANSLAFRENAPTSTTILRAALVRCGSVPRRSQQPEIFVVLDALAQQQGRVLLSVGRPAGLALLIVQLGCRSQVAYRRTAPSR
jgi:hypothetical protein